MSSPNSNSPQTQVDDANAEFLTDIVNGLKRQPRSLPCKYFYDQHGSKLFDQICELDEYYLTRTELAIMERYLAEMANQISSQVMLVEFGSGSSTKTRKLLAQLDDPVAYVPIDISREHLMQTAAELQRQFPTCEILPVVADFTTDFKLPESKRRASHAAVYFPGSTIGNFELPEASQLLQKFAQLVGPQGGLLIGIDLQKDAGVLEAAYDDAKGITAEFNLNLLHRINRELGADFDVDSFQHRATYNQEHGRIEMHLVSRRDQTVTIGEHSFDFTENEALLTEYSHKYTVEGFAKLAARAGFKLRQNWSDDSELFAVLHLVNESG